MKTKKAGRKISLFNFLVTVFFSAGIIVFFVNNIIAVNKLVDEQNELANDLDKTVSINNSLAREIERLSEYDKIKNIVENKLKMRFLEAKSRKIIIAGSDLIDR